MATMPMRVASGTRKRRRLLPALNALVAHVEDSLTTPSTQYCTPAVDGRECAGESGRERVAECAEESGRERVRGRECARVSGRECAGESERA